MGHWRVLALDDAAERAAADLALDAAERTPPLELPAAETPERHRPVLALDANALGQDAADLVLDAAAPSLSRLAHPFPSRCGARYASPSLSRFAHPFPSR